MKCSLKGSLRHKISEFKYLGSVLLALWRQDENFNKDWIVAYNYRNLNTLLDKKVSYGIPNRKGKFQKYRNYLTIYGYF